MRINIITLFPEVCQTVLNSSILKRAQNSGALDVVYINPRDFTSDNHKSVDDTPYGGGAGMVLRVDVYAAAIQSVPKNNGRNLTILLTPQGKTFDQQAAGDIAKNYDQITLVCGHYEGFDERIRAVVDREISIGNYVLTGGELPALVVVDAIARLLPGVLKETSPEEESFSIKDEKGNPLLEYPQYTRPVEYQGMKVPEVLLSGHHAEIAKWRLEQAKERTKNAL